MTKGDVRSASPGRPGLLGHQRRAVATMTTYPGDDDGLEATEVPVIPGSAMDPDEGPGPEADAPDDGGDGVGPANSDPGF
jgi:hypothetical protein